MSTSATHNQHNIFSQSTFLTKTKQPTGRVGQDNNAPRRVRRASSEPSPVEYGTRTRPLQPPSAPARKRSTKRQTVMAAGWVKKPVSAELDRIAKQEGVTRSRVIATLLEEAVHQRLHVQHAVLLQPIIEQAIAAQLQRDRARFAALLVRIAFDANTTRHLVGNILGRQDAVTPEAFDRIRDWCTRKAKDSITARTPQIEELIQAVDAWLAGSGEGSEGTT